MVTTHDDLHNANHVVLYVVLPIIHNPYDKKYPLGSYIMKLKETCLGTPAFAQVPLKSIMHSTSGIPLDILNPMSLMGWS